MLRYLKVTFFHFLTYQITEKNQNAWIWQLAMKDTFVTGEEKIKSQTMREAPLTSSRCSHFLQALTA